MIGPDYRKRGYLLPEGCKDLIDAIKLQAATAGKAPLPPGQPGSRARELVVHEPISVRELAKLLGQAPFQIVGDLMQFGVFANVNQHLAFEVVAKVARKYGYRARKQS